MPYILEVEFRNVRLFKNFFKSINAPPIIEVQIYKLIITILQLLNNNPLLNQRQRQRNRLVYL